ncbi:hydrogenase nickel incorporation protein HypB [Rhodopseudomonas pseudopalustris]|uniref:Hydrogenase maturation factor HypB n=1 Tax=Rhodopseudomonas pseudopalustris TaxID=1513892 RepID=A0A1H8NM20_9BRAD|nr:hydrogenase nickel incorporation protein HypB [Rhodopseudomonas pseudopalustris]SEO30654.1 Hydrogenase nickel incorporation protein HypB [Rhodopseudomonas pseudopalustris]
MCTVCGCGDSSVDPGHAHGHAHDHDHPHDHAHPHGHDHAHPHDHDHGHEPHHHDHHHNHDHAHPAAAAGSLDFGGGIAGVHVAGLTQARVVQIERDILSKNDSYAAANRARFAASGAFALNFVSSPGSGKTTLLVKTITDLKDSYPIAVIEGDQQTANDAERIRATGAPAIQINTGKGCHLDAHMVGHALDQLPAVSGGLLFIENVGNLVCPAAFDLGEAHKVVVLSVTEGEDKPLKYPHMFAAADLLLLNKIDLLPHLDFDLAATIEYARRVNPKIEVLTVSAKSGEGLPAFYAWIAKRAAAARAAAKAAG